MLKKFTALLDRFPDEIQRYRQFPINFKVLEGSHNKIKLINRIAYGFRDEAHFFLQIPDALAGFPDEPISIFRAVHEPLSEHASIDHICG